MIDARCVEIDVRSQRHTLAMDLEDLLAAFTVRDRDRDLAVETAGPPERRIEDVGKVRGSDDDQVLSPGKAVHQGQELRDDPLLNLAHDLLAARGDRVDFIDKDDARRLSRSFLEDLPKVRLAFPVEFMNDFRAVHREKTGFGLLRHGTSDQRLAAPGRTMQEHTLGRVDSESLEDLRVAQRQLDDFADPMELTLESADVLVRERHGRFLRLVLVLGLRAADLEHRARPDHGPGPAAPCPQP